jgi:hypothetical protein
MRRMKIAMQEQLRREIEKGRKLNRKMVVRNN